MRVARESMRIINGYRFALCSYRFNKMADVSERFSDTLGKPEASDIQVITHNMKKKKKRKYYYVSSTSESWSNDSDCQQFDKCQKTKKKKHGSNEQKQGNRKKKKKTFVNSHATITARLTEQ